LAEEGRKPQKAFDFVQGNSAGRHLEIETRQADHISNFDPRECGDSKVVRNAPHASSPGSRELVSKGRSERESCRHAPDSGM
jgi:hypothetical protein